MHSDGQKEAKLSFEVRKWPGLCRKLLDLWEK